MVSAGTKFSGPTVVIVFFDKFLVIGLDISIIISIIYIMKDVDDILIKMKQSPSNVQFKELCKICNYYFGLPRQSGSSHRIYKMPWRGDPRVNIQNAKGKAKAYQVTQVLRAIKKLEEDRA
jgi:hypothetical protein